MSKNISIHTKTPHMDAAEIEVVITLPTFKRPQHLLTTLNTLNAQITNRKYCVIVMENEAEHQEGAKAAAPLFESGHLNGMIIIVHQRGNCCAYNAGWQTALENFENFKFLMVIDDDELADTNWLETMCQSARDLECDIVGGPQIPIFESDEHQHFHSHPVFTPPYKKSGKVDALYSSGNLIIARNVLETMPAPYLNLMFNFMGGGDADFLSRCSQRGFQLGWCAQAPVHETTPTRRLDKDWLRARAIRNGVISTLVEKRKRRSEPFGQTKVWLKSIALLLSSLARSIKIFVQTKSLSIAAYPILIGLGRIMGHFGYKNEQYRNAEQN